MSSVGPNCFLTAASPLYLGSTLEHAFRLLPRRSRLVGLLIRQAEEAVNARIVGRLLFAPRLGASQNKPYGGRIVLAIDVGKGAQCVAADVTLARLQSGE